MRAPVLQPGPLTRKALSTRKKVAFALVLNLAVFALAECAGVVGLRSWGVPLAGELAFHPLFRRHALRSAAIGGERFTFDPYLGYRFTPGRGWVNEHGFVAGEGPFPDLSKPHGAGRRVFVLGGSTVAGSGASSADGALPAALGRALKAKDGRGWEVVNAGVDGYSSFNQLVYFQGDLASRRPDAVVFYDGWNDYAYATWAGGYKDAYQRDHARQNYHEYALYLATVMPTLMDPPLVNTASLLSRFYVTAWLRFEYVRRFGTREGLQSTLDVSRLQGKVLLSPEEAADVYCGNVRSAVGAAKAHGIPVLYALQPTVLDKALRAPPEEDFLTFRPALTRRESNPGTIRRFYGRARSCLAELASRENGPGVRVVDLSKDVWNGVSEPVFVDECHLWERGNDIVAARLADELSRLRLRTPVR